MPTLYVDVKRSVHKQEGEPLYMKDAAILHLSGQPKPPDAGEVLLGNVQRGWHSIDALELISILEGRLPQETEMQLLGESACHVYGRSVSKPKPLITGLTTLLLIVLLFFGGAMAVINFHADVDMPKVHKTISELLLGADETGSLWVSIPYSLGIALGIGIFAGVGRRKSRPNLLELEEFEYRSKVEDYQMDKSERESDA